MKDPLHSKPVLIGKARDMIVEGLTTALPLLVPGTAYMPMPLGTVRCYVSEVYGPRLTLIGDAGAVTIDGTAGELRGVLLDLLAYLMEVE